MIAVDLDLGGANLHSLFGREHARFTVADALRGQIDDYEEALLPTAAPGVRLLSGTRAPLDAANPKYAQKQRLLRHMRRLKARHVVLDLGAGSHFDTLDAFLAADRRILVVTPEPTAIENAHHFLKAAFFRSLRPIAREPEVREALEAVLAEARLGGMSPAELVEAAWREDAAAGSRLRAAVRGFRIDLVVNRWELGGRDPGPELAAACHAKLGAQLRPMATLPVDESVPAAVERGVPAQQLFPGCSFSTAVGELVERMLAPETEERAGRATKASKAPAPPPIALKDFDPAAPGASLRLCREFRGLSLEDVCRETRIRQLPQIESEHFDALPPDPYVRSFVRQYAELLGISSPAPDRIADAYLALVQRRRDQLGGRRRRGLRIGPFAKGWFGAARRPRERSA